MKQEKRYFMSINFALIGGDLRNIRLAEELAKEGHQIKIYGLEKQKERKNYTNIEFCDTLEQTISSTKWIIGPVPFSKDGIFVQTQENTVTIEELFQKMENQTLLAGSFSKEIQEKAQENKVKIIDLMKQEELAILNAIATAEGTIELMIHHTEKNLQGQKVLILGFGRIAKVLANKLHVLGCRVTCSARKQEDLAWIETNNYQAVSMNKIEETLKNYEIIVNTVPYLILTKEKLNQVKPDSLLIELASKPGGIDFQATEERHIKAIKALGLPGKVAPTSSAQYIKKTIEEIIEKERKKENE